MKTEHRVASNPQTKPIDLGCESAKNWQLPSTSTAAIVIPAKARDYVFTGVVYGVLDSNLHTRLAIVTEDELGLASPLGTFPPKNSNFGGKVPRGESKPKFVFGYYR